MRSRAGRLTLGALAVMLFGAAAFFLFTTERQIAVEQDRVRTFDLRAREAADTLADLRVAQQAYVAAGQGIAFWIPKVAATAETASTAIAALRASASTGTAQASLGDAATALTEFSAADKRARDYLTSGQELMAADVVFTEGGESAAAAGRQIQAARLAENQAADASAAARRRQEAAALAAAGVAGTLVLLMLALARPAVRASSESVVATTAPDAAAPHQHVDRVVAPVADAGGLSLREPAESSAPAATPMRVISPMLTAAAALCTDFGRVRDLDELRALLSRAAQVMEASGLVVWLGNAAGADLRPALAHGYAEQTIARMPPVPRSGQNAAAAAYRTGALQLVLSQPGGATGAIVAPLLSADGCIGALSVEIKGGGETSDAVQALAAIFAAQLAGILAAPAAEDAAPAENKAAARG
jgi:hypothetical protein